MTRVGEALLGCLLGGALGDALGRPFENAVAPQPMFPAAGPLRVTDDTQLSFATAQAIVACEGRVDPATIAEAFAEGFRASRFRGLGASTYKALSELAQGGHWALVGRKGEHAAGNGAAMRIAPLAFVLDPFDVDARTAYRDVCRMTHHSDEAYVGALAVAMAVRLAWTGSWSGGQDLLEAIAGALPDSRVRDRLLELAPDRSERLLEELARQWGASGYAVESVPLALCAAERFGRLGYLGMLEEVVRCGGDADTIGSIAGQVVGARFGATFLPVEFVSRLEVEREARELAAGLAGFVS